MRVDSFIIQVSAAADRGPQEEAIIAEGMVPIVVFANDPEHAYLVRARVEDIDAALEAAWDRVGEPADERLDFVESVFDAMAEAVEKGFDDPDAPHDFPNDAVILFAEALVDHDIETAGEIVPCAVRFVRDDLENPDYEIALEE
jgi:hypothetical protein